MMLRRKKFFLLFVPIISILFVLLFFFRSHRQSLIHLIKGKSYNYVLITIDTLRADRLGCYGFAHIETPNLDLFTSRGIKFEHCISQTPLTLPSHVSIMTGTQPTFHGVRDNAGNLVPQELITIAELFKRKGYQTAAFVAAYVLDSFWGLNQGFDYYFDKFDLSQNKGFSLGDVQRRAEQVIDEVIPWLKTHKNEKFFTWIHLYDPHTPYEPPAPYIDKYADAPYLGEIAYVDEQVGRLWKYLENNDLLKNTVLILTSDHGESLGEHQESAHGFFIYQKTLHVPLIFVIPARKLEGLHRDGIVSLVDVMPTILDIAEIPVPSQVQGKSLIPQFLNNKTVQDDFSYSETYYPRLHYGWSELKGIQDDKFKLILAPKNELYDLKKDPDEENNLASTYSQEVTRLKRTLEKYIADTSQNAFNTKYYHVDEETRQKLTALGYVAALADSSHTQGKGFADPKDKIFIFNQLSEASELGLQGQFGKAVEIIKGIISQEPDILDAYATLGNLYFSKNKFGEAIKYFFMVLDKEPDDTNAIINIASSYLNMGKLAEAEKIIFNSSKSVQEDPQLYLILGYCSKLQNRYDQAISYFMKCLNLTPYFASAYRELGEIYTTKENFDEAERYLKKAIEINPTLIDAHFDLAQLFEKRVDIPSAVEEYKRELANNPHSYRASFNLSVIYRSLKDIENEKNFLEITILSNPEFPLSYFYLARLYTYVDHDYQKALNLVNKGISLKPEREYLPIGYFLLADIYNRLGNYSLSQKYAQKGKEFQRLSLGSDKD